MFFYYQIRNHPHKTVAVPEITCPLCHTAGHMQMNFMQKYAWVLGPIVPSGKFAMAFCEHCNNYVPAVRWTDEMDTVFQNHKRELKTPRRLYRGLIVFPLAMVVIIGAIILVTKVKGNKQQANQTLVKEAIAHPRKGDIFQINQSDGTNTNYTYFKVASTRGDSVYIYPSTVHLTDMKDMKQWDEIPVADDAYEKTPITFSIKQAQTSDMFTYNTQPAMYGIVWSLYRDGQLYKKY